MPAALVFRGHAHRGPVGKPGCDWRPCVGSQWRFLYARLKARYGGVDTFLCGYDTPLWADAVKDYAPLEWRHATPGATQRQTFLKALEVVYDGDRYAVVAVCRFDLELHASPIDHPNFDPGNVNFLWREWNQQSWDSHRRVPDTMHFLPGRLLTEFRDAAAEPPSEHCLHTMYWPLARRVGEEKINILVRDGFIDNNTDVMPNPFYRIVRC